MFLGHKPSWEGAVHLYSGGIRQVTDCKTCRQTVVWDSADVRSYR